MWGSRKIGTILNRYAPKSTLVDIVHYRPSIVMNCSVATEIKCKDRWTQTLSIVLIVALYADWIISSKNILLEAKDKNVNGLSLFQAS